jgi:hypothetical protein
LSLNCAIASDRLESELRMLQHEPDGLMTLIHKRINEIQCSVERRKECRNEVYIRTSMRLLDPACPDKIAIEILDISESGLRIACDRYIVPGSTLQLRLGKRQVLGVVRYGIAAGSCSWYGVKLQTYH